MNTSALDDKLDTSEIVTLLYVFLDKLGILDRFKANLAVHGMYIKTSNLSRYVESMKLRYKTEDYTEQLITAAFPWNCKKGEYCFWENVNSQWLNAINVYYEYSDGWSTFIDSYGLKIHFPADDIIDI